MSDLLALPLPPPQFDLLAIPGVREILAAADPVPAESFADEVRRAIQPAGPIELILEPNERRLREDWWRTYLFGEQEKRS